MSSRPTTMSKHIPSISSFAYADSNNNHIPSRTGQSRPAIGGANGCPWTAQSRPTTARPQTAASTRYEASYIIALLEGRGIAREVGMAAMDMETGRIVLVQLADCQTYVKTLHQMHLHRPSMVLVPDTFLSASDRGYKKRYENSTKSMLVELIQEEFPGVPVEAVPRKYWNEQSGESGSIDPPDLLCLIHSTGLEFIQQLCVDDEERAGTILAVSTKYYVLSTASALFKYAEIRLNVRFSTASLRIRYAPVDGTMMIDPESAKNLELVGNMTHKKSTHSLFGVLNHTYTPMATRLLRVNILSPITVQSSIDARLDVVEEFIQDQDLFNDVKNALKGLAKVDFDKLIAVLVSSEARPSTTAQAASSRVSQMLNLRNIVRNLPLLRKALEGSGAQLLRIIHEMLSDERLGKIDALIRSSLNEDAISAKHGIAATNVRVYAVKANYNRLLDVARETYKENVGDIYSLANSLSDAHMLPLTLVYQETGFVFSLKKTELDGELPRGFINVALKRGKWQFSSMELKKMNARMKDALDETLILSDKIIQDLVAEILADIGALYKASEAVALIDMLWGFAHASIMRNYIRPEFTGTLAIKSGRHPILEIVKAPGTLVPNDVYGDDSSLFQIIQGPNMSGKSTYLRQVALLTVMAMCGSFVPVEYASFRIHDALLTRLSNDDDLEKSLSTFASEMATSAMILGLATPKSLVIIDELGRGTSPREGVGISHAIAEGLIEQKCFVFFATHFSELSTTLSRQPSVLASVCPPNTPFRGKLWNDFSVQDRGWRSGRYDSLWFVNPLAIARSIPYSSLVRLGLELARLADLPNDILVEATRVANRLTELQSRHQEASESSKIALRRKALIRVIFSALPPESYCTSFVPLAL
uniref:DNA mismatch repair proteins mutS family domain-containing protein n=1 Tax=Moniliophthora roreri TaxID=221103 RepID=A0A0W0G5I1_MONRR